MLTHVPCTFGHTVEMARDPSGSSAKNQPMGMGSLKLWVVLGWFSGFLVAFSVFFVAFSFFGWFSVLIRVFSVGF